MICENHKSILYAIQHYMQHHSPLIFALKANPCKVLLRSHLDNTIYNLVFELIWQRASVEIEFVKYYAKIINTTEFSPHTILSATWVDGNYILQLDNKKELSISTEDKRISDFLKALFI